MALFRCNRSGNTVEFKYDFDIVEMRRHPEYTEVITSSVIVIDSADGTRQTITLKRPMGRPRKEQLV